MASTSSGSSLHKLRKDFYVSIVGYISNQIVGAKLPSNQQVLSVFFYNVRVVNLTTKESAALVIQEVSIFWQKARIPTKRTDHCIDKLLKLYDEWKGLQKNLTRTAGKEKEKRDLFVEKMDDLFDIAHSDALGQMKNEEDKKFLMLQRQKGRPGSMIGVDQKLKYKEERALKRSAMETARKKRTYEEMEQHFATHQPAAPKTDDSTSSSQSSDGGDDSENSSIIVQKISPTAATAAAVPTTRGTLHFFTPRLSEVFDRCKITDRNAVYILMAAAEAFGRDTENLVVNRTSFQRLRKKFRDSRHTEIQHKFNLNNCQELVLHWDGKLLPALTGVEKVDRLAIIVTFQGKEQLLGVPEIPTSSGEEQAMAVYQAVEKWGITDKIQALCCDTTASNTGRQNGACTNLEKLFNRDLLYLPCRHHIFELVLRSCFDSLMDATSGPDMVLFKRFRETWTKIDKNVYITDSNEVPDDVRSTILQFIEHQLSTQKQLRDDYRELLELTMIFLGGIPKNGVSFHVPGAVSHARWMSKAIYAFKIFLFQDQFQLSHREKNSLRRICIFLARVYVRAWFLSSEAIKAPYHDFLFMRQLVNYQAIDPEISKAAAKKFSNHLWYLVPETVALSLFDDNVPTAVKASMAQVMLEADKSEEQEEDKNQLKRYILHQKDFPSFTNIEFSSFVTPSSKNFFTRFSISSDFLDKDPSTWKDDVGYKSGIEKLQTIVVVNDVAERGVKLIQDYNNILTKDEAEKQFILQIVAGDRKKYPTATKSSLRKK